MAGDWHGSAHAACAAIGYAARRGIGTVLQLGDFGYWVPGPRTRMFLESVEIACAELGVTLLWVDGNHEDFSQLLELPIDPGTGLRAISPHVHHLPRGLRWTWHGRTWMALGGAHSVDKHRRIEGRSWWPEEHLTEAEVQAAISPGPVDVIVSHDAPDGVPIPGLSPHQFPAEQIAIGDWHRRQVGNVVDAVGPGLLMHGHYHVRYRTQRGRTEVIGLADNTARLVDNIMVMDVVGLKPIDV
ncbi:MAG: hypothetical protein WAV90_00595 [Gordonia amarae]